MIFKPTKILKIKLDDHLQEITNSNPSNKIFYEYAEALVILHEHPIGMVKFPLLEEITKPDYYAPIIWNALGKEINYHLINDNLPPIHELNTQGIVAPLGTFIPCYNDTTRHENHFETISVVVCTHERPGMLRNCLKALLAIDYPKAEFIIVDNAPKSEATRNIVREFESLDSRIRYVKESNQGQCWARNTGAKLARGEIIAYTDDDVIVDPNWLKGVSRGFTSSTNVGAVNGLTIPAELDTIEQTWFEQSGGFNKGYQSTIYDLDIYKPPRPFYPFSAGIFGTGANLSIRKSALEKVGYFDPALGAGTITTCGDDLAMYLQLLYAGYKLVYEPSALVQHVHRNTMQDLEKQLFDYGVGFTAFLTKTLLERPYLIPGFLAKIPYGVFILFSPTSMKNSKKKSGYPNKLNNLEYKGMLVGGIRYLFSRWKAGRIVADSVKSSQ